MATEAAPDTGHYILHHLTFLQYDLQKKAIVEGSQGFWVLNLDSVIFSVWPGRDFLPAVLAGRAPRHQRRARQVAELHRDVRRLRRQPGQGRLPPRREIRGANGAVRVLLGVPDELHGPAAGRPAADRLAAGSAPNTCASCPRPIRTSRWRCRSRCSSPLSSTASSPRASRASARNSCSIRSANG